MKTLSLILPTNSAETFYHILSPLSLENIAPLAKFYKVELLIAGQGEFDENAYKHAERLCYEYCVDAKIIQLPETNPPFYARLRQAAAMLNDTADYYMFVDHNMEFSHGNPKYKLASWHFIKECLEFLDANEKCGAVQCAGSFGGNHAGKEIMKYERGKIISTDRGIICKNLFKGQLFAEEVIMMPGSCEDMALGIFFNMNGYWIAKQFHHPTKHHNLRKFGDCDDENTHDRQIAEENILGWIKKNFKPDYEFGDKIFNMPPEFYKPYLINQKQLELGL